MRQHSLIALVYQRDYFNMYENKASRMKPGLIAIWREN